MADMNDVAKLAGVSRGTVSNYVNGVKVKESTRVKVEAAIKELDYVPNLAGRLLKTQQSDLVVLIVPTIWNPFFSELAFYLERGLKKSGLKLILCNSEDDYQQEIEYIQMAKEQKVRGIITVSYSDIEPYVTSDLPIVSIERYFDETVPFVTSDNFIGGELAAKELSARGATKLLMLMRDIENNLGLTERVNGFKSYCHQHQIEFDVLIDTGDGLHFKERLKQRVTDLYQDGIPYDGIFAATDRYAQYCWSTLQGLGIKVPEEVQIIGFDGTKASYHAELLVSSIRQPVDKIAEIGIQELLQLEKRPRGKQNKHILRPTFEAAYTTK